MKIICPGHLALIDIPQKEIHEAMLQKSGNITFTCPVCADEVLISDIRVEIIFDKLGRRPSKYNKNKITSTGESS